MRGIKEVAKLQKLERLILDDTRIAKMGVDELQKVLDDFREAAGIGVEALNNLPSYNVPTSGAA